MREPTTIHRYQTMNGQPAPEGGLTTQRELEVGRVREASGQPETHLPSVNAQRLRQPKKGR